MRSLHPVDAGVSAAADAALYQALAGRPLISAERFTSSMRTAYAGPSVLSALRPVVAIGCYPAWSAASAATVLAAEARTGIRGALQRHTWMDTVDQEAKALLSGLQRPPVITAWYTTARLRSWAGAAGAVAAIDGGLRAEAEHKAAFGRLLTDAGVPERMHIPSLRVDTHLPALSELRKRLGTRRLVVQAGADSGGRGTRFVDTEADMEPAAAMSGPYRVAAYVEGWSSNTTALSVPNSSGGVTVYVDRPSHKAVGVGEAGIGPGKSCGNDWSKPWPTATAGDLVEAAVRVGTHLWRTRRMCGLFGLDAIVTPDGRALLNEINCRNQGTTEVSGVNQHLRGWPPFIAAHLTVLLGGRVDWLPDATDFNRHTVIAAGGKGPGPFYLKLRHRGRQPVRLTGLRGPGVYALTGDRLAWLREGADPADADADIGEVLLTALPDETTVCLPGAELGTAEALTTGPGSPFTAPHDLSPFGRAVISALGHQLVPVSPSTTAR